MGSGIKAFLKINEGLTGARGVDNQRQPMFNNQQAAV